MPKKSNRQRWLQACPLRRWRLKQPPEGWNRAVVARQLGVTPAAVSAWELGQKEPSLGSLVKIRRLTGITPEAWLAWINRRPKRSR